MEVDTNATAARGQVQCGKIWNGESSREGGEGQIVNGLFDPRDRFTLQAEREFRSSIRPIYRNSARKPRPIHLASCLLLDVDGVPTVCTAAHVADHSFDHDLYIGGVVGGRLIHVPKNAFTTTAAPEGNRDADHYDFAFWQPQDYGSLEPLGNVRFIPHWQIADDHSPTQTRLYTSIGYARSRNKNKVDHAKKAIETRISMYSAHAEAMAGLAELFAVTGAEHIFQHWTPQSFAGSTRMNTFGARGLSGGALLDLGEFPSDTSYERDPEGNAKLAGIIIEYYEEHQALVSVKIQTVLNSIRLGVAWQKL